VFAGSLPTADYEIQGAEDLRQLDISSLESVETD
jgi:hypothetical protein